VGLYFPVELGVTLNEAIVADVTESAEQCGADSCGGVYEINAFTACSGEPAFTEGVQIGTVD
jgi:hypothetical protein